MVDRLVEQLRECPEITHIVLTRNIAETSVIVADRSLEVVHNLAPKGFGANHNAAFAFCRDPFYCVLNPDIELTANPFPALLQCLYDPTVMLAAPVVVAPAGTTEDSIRHFPTPWSLLRKAFGGYDGRYVVKLGDPTFFPDWVAGMFMLFRSSGYAALKGFDEDYFLYYEDVDICRRIRETGMKVAACPATVAIHDARRSSHRNLRHLRWHFVSAMRYLWRWS